MNEGSVSRVREAARQLGLSIEILEMPTSTHTAEDAAQACGCELSQIVKSLIFERQSDGKLVLLLIPGDRQADLNAAADVAGGALNRSTAKRVREEAGFAIGGVAPLGHLSSIPVFMHRSLLDHELVWAAAGAPNAVFAVDPIKLCEAIGASIIPTA